MCLHCVHSNASDIQAFETLKFRLDFVFKSKKPLDEIRNSREHWRGISDLFTNTTFENMMQWTFFHESAIEIETEITNLNKLEK